MPDKVCVVCVRAYVRGGRGGTGSNKAADCRESGRVSEPAADKETPVKCAAFLTRTVPGGPSDNGARVPTASSF